MNRRDFAKREIMRRIACDLKSAIDAIHDAEMGGNGVVSFKGEGLTLDGVRALLSIGDPPLMPRALTLANGETRQTHRRAKLNGLEHGEPRRGGTET